MCDRYGQRVWGRVALVSEGSWPLPILMVSHVYSVPCSHYSDYQDPIVTLVDKSDFVKLFTAHEDHPATGCDGREHVLSYRQACNKVR